jgi:hypothetical protein
VIRKLEVVGAERGQLGEVGIGSDEKVSAQVGKAPEQPKVGRDIDLDLT